MKISIVLGLLAFLSLSVFSSDRQHKGIIITKVIDGDTVIAKLEEKPVRVRLAEIDAPEIDQPWGLNAKKALEAKVLGRRIVLEVIDIDRYDRLVARLILDGREINREMIAEGHVWVYRRYMRDKSLLVDEDIAVQNNNGFWAKGGEIAPWEWRRGKRNDGISSITTVTRSCEEKPYCSNLKTCDEAIFFLQICHLKRLDGDNDGLPCESLCKP